MGIGRRARAISVLIVCALFGCVAPRTRGADCVFNRDCDDPLVCAGGSCRAQCATDRDCPSGQQCALAEDARKNVCFDPRANRACTAQTCGSGQRCADGVCVRDCAASCPSGSVCSADGLFCVLDPRVNDGGMDVASDASLDATNDVTNDLSQDAPDAMADTMPDAVVDAGSDASACNPPSGASTSCAAGLTLCAGRCVSPRESSSHCGTNCAAACPERAACVEGSCASWSVLSFASNTYATYVARSGGLPVLGWGVANSGALGARTSDSDTPVEILGTDDAIAVAAGYRSGCAIVGATRAVRCWGWGMAGVVDGTDAHVRRTPADVPGLVGAIEIAVGNNFACALRGGGEVVCWGRTGRGYLGEVVADAGAATFVWAPMVVPIPAVASTVLHIAAGDTYACALVSGMPSVRNVYCWGFDQESVVGRPVAGNIAVPDAIATSLDSPAQTILARSKTTCVTTARGSVYCWGENTFGMSDPAVPGSPNVVEPRRVGGMPTGFVASSLGALEQSWCALERCGRALCWGNDFERSVSVLATPISADAGLPTQLLPTIVTSATGPLYPGLVALSGMVRGACALRTDGTLDCWGNSERGSVGSGRTISAPTWPR